MFAIVSLLYVVSSVAATGRHPVPVTVYYETLCPYSERFLLNKLIPTYRDKNFARLLANLTLIPYGHVDVVNASLYDYSCQHGQPECEGNKLHGCAIKYVEDKAMLLNYLGCLVNASESTTSKMSYPVNACKDLVPNNQIQKISNCFNSSEGWNIFNEFGTITDSFFGPNRFYVPYVAFNNEKDGDLSDIAKRDFRKMLCKKNGVRNSSCSDYKTWN